MSKEFSQLKQIGFGKWFLLSRRLFVLGLVALLGMGCAISRKYLAVEGKGKIALVSFYLDRSIVEDGTEQDTGPGIFQKKENYYQYHQEAVDAMWAQVKDSAVAAFGNADFIPFEDVFTNATYPELTTYAPIKLLGLQMVPGSENLYPAGCRYVSGRDPKVMAGLFVALGADYLLIFDHDASARFTGMEAKIGAREYRKGVLVLTTSITLYHKTDGLVWSMYKKTESDTQDQLVDHELNPELLPRMLVEAQSRLWNAIRSEVELGRKSKG